MQYDKTRKKQAIERKTDGNKKEEFDTKQTTHPNRFSHKTATRNHLVFAHKTIKRKQNSTPKRTAANRKAQQKPPRAP